MGNAAYPDIAWAEVLKMCMRTLMAFMITSSMELPADVFTIVGITWFGRRWSASLSLLLCGITMVVCAFVKGQNVSNV